MAAPWLAVLVKSVPWVELAKRTPEIIEGSRRLLERSRSAAESPTAFRGRPTIDELAERVQHLEQRDVEHAKIVEQMVAQLTDLTNALAVLDARNRRLRNVIVALVVLIVAAVVAIVAGWI